MAEPIIDIHQHTNYANRSDLALLRHQRHMGVTQTILLPAGTPVGTPDLWFDPCVFAVPPEGFLGNAPRNSVRGPGLVNLDIALAKDTAMPALGSNGRIEFRAEVFNVLNHANFATPEVGVADSPAAAVVFPGGPDERNAAGQVIPQRRLPTVGKILKTTTSSRQIQFSLRLLF